MIELSSLDAQPRLHGACVGAHVRPLGEAEPFGPACRHGQLGLGGRGIAAYQRDQGQVKARRRDRLGGTKPLGVDLVLTLRLRA